MKGVDFSSSHDMFREALSYFTIYRGRERKEREAGSGFSHGAWKEEKEEEEDFSNHRWCALHLGGSSLYSSSSSSPTVVGGKPAKREKRKISVKGGGGACAATNEHTTGKNFNAKDLLTTYCLAA